MSSLLKETTGILGREILVGGIPWELLRPFAMKLQLPFDAIIIDLGLEEQTKLKNLIQL